MMTVKNILIARDFAACSDYALQYALDLAKRTGATLHVLYAEVLHGEAYDPQEHPPTIPDRLRERIKQANEAQFGHSFDPGSVSIEHAVVRNIAAAPAILDYAAAHDVDVIVLGTHGRRGVRRLLLGSVAAEVTRLAQCPVLTVRTPLEPDTPADGRIETILVPIDFSAHSQEALRYARALAGLYGARLDLLHVVEDRLHPAFYGITVQSIYDVQPDIEQKAVAELQKLYEQTSGPMEGPEVPARFRAMPGVAAQTITRYAEDEGSDLIVMATHGRRGLEHVLVGSVTDRTMRLAPCPVFTVKSFGKSLLPPETASKASAPQTDTEVLPC